MSGDTNTSVVLCIVFVFYDLFYLVLPRQEAFAYCHRIGSECVDIVPLSACIFPMQLLTLHLASVLAP